MKTEEILARVNDAMQPYEAIEKADDSRSYNAGSIAWDMKERLAKLAAELEAQVRLEYAASNNSLSATRVITKMLEHEKKHGCRKSLQYAWLDGDGRQCVCDGYRAFRLNDPLPLEPRPDDAGDTIDLDKIMPDGKGYVAAPLPSAKELRAYIATEKAKMSLSMRRKGGDAVLWHFGEGRPSVNANYLLDLVQVFPDATEIFCGTETKIFSPLFLHCERGDAILLPVRTNRAVAEIEAARKAKEEAEAELRDRAEAEGIDPEVLREREARRAKRKADAEKAFADRLAMIRAETARCPEYSLELDEFEELVELMERASSAA